MTAAIEIVESGPGRGCPRVEGVCPSCNARSLFLGAGARVTCASLSCTSPCAVDEYLDSAEKSKSVADLQQQVGSLRMDRREAYTRWACDMRERQELSRLLRGMARRTAVLRGKLLDEYLPDRGASRAPREPRERQDAPSVEKLAAVVQKIQDEGTGDSILQPGAAFALGALAEFVDCQPMWGAMDVARALVAAGAQGEPGPAADTRPRAEYPCPDCGGEVLRVDHAMDPSDYRCRDQFDCCWRSETAPPDPEVDDNDGGDDQ